MPPEPPSARAPQGLSLQGVDWLPSGGGSGLLRVRGRWAEGDSRADELPVLLAGESSFGSLPDSRPGFGRLAGSWRGAYVVPVALAAQRLALEWEDGSRVELPEVGLAGSSSPGRPEGHESGPEEPAGELIDRGVLAERRARRAEDSEREQARVAREALAAVRGLEQRGAELEARLRELTEGDERRAVLLEAVEHDAAAAAGEHDGLRDRVLAAEARVDRQVAALAEALETAARARAEAADARSRLRASETARQGEAVRSAVVDAERGLLVARLAAAREQAARLARARATAERDARAAAGDVLASRAQATALRAQLEATESESNRVAAARERLAETLAEVRDALAAARGAARDAEAEIAAARSRAEAAEAAARTERLARAALAANLERERARRAALERDGAAARERVLALERDGAAARDRVLELERDRAAARERVLALEQKLAAGLSARAADEALRARAREQAAAAAAATARVPRAGGAGLATDLDAAAAALRSRFPREDSGVVEPGGPEPADPKGPAAAGAAAEGPPPPGPAAEPSPALAPPGPRWLRRALVRFAQDDPVAAGRLLAGLLPAQVGLVAGELDYDLTIRGVGTYAVSVAADGVAVRALPRPRPRGQAELHLRTDPRSLAELIAGVPQRIGRLAAPVRLRGRRRALAALAPVRGAQCSLADAARAGAELEPGLVLRAMAYAVSPAWTSGQRFAVLFELAGEEPEAWLVRARDGAGVTVSRAAPGAPADATVSIPRAAFPALLRAESPPAGSRPSVRGDRAAVARLKAWLDFAQGAAAAAPGTPPVASAAGLG